jgi:hypothetical protein
VLSEEMVVGQRVALQVERVLGILATVVAVVLVKEVVPTLAVVVQV